MYYNNVYPITENHPRDIIGCCYAISRQYVYVIVKFRRPNRVDSYLQREGAEEEL